MLTSIYSFMSDAPRELTSSDQAGMVICGLAFFFLAASVILLLTRR